MCVLLKLFSIRHLLSWPDGTLMSVGQSSSSRAHLQTFQNSCRLLCIWYCVVVISVYVKL